MVPLDQARAAKLIALAKSSFDVNLSAAEIHVLRESAGAPLPDAPQQGVALPSVRAGLIRWLVTCADVPGLLDPIGLRVHAEISGELDLREIRFPLRLDFRDCTFSHLILLSSAETGGLFLQRVRPAKGIVADRLVCRGPLSLEGAIFAGMFRLSGAEIYGDLNCADCDFLAVKAVLNLESIQVHGNVFFSNVVIRREVTFSGAKIEQSLDFTRATFSATPYSCSLDNVVIGQNLSAKRIEAAGFFRVVGARIGGNADFAGSMIAFLSADRLRLEGDFNWAAIRTPQKCRMVLNGASVNNFRDDRASWPGDGNLWVDGLVYRDLTLHGTPSDEEIDKATYSTEFRLEVADRIEWIKRQRAQDWPEPQPWLQLAKLLEEKGRKRDARHVLYELARVQSRESSPLWRSATNAFAWLEEQPFRILWSVAVLLVLGSILYWHGDRNGAMAPTSPNAYPVNAKGQAQNLAYPEFNAIMYTLENELPLIKLGQDANWAPSSTHPAKGWREHYLLLASFRWMLILLGWMQAAALGAAVSARFKS